MAKTARTYSNRTLQAIRVLATQIQLARKQHRWTEAELAERAGASRSTIRMIEDGNPATGLGLYFEVATLLGISLYDADSQKLTDIQHTLDLKLALLPSRIDKHRGEVFDDF
ncbi:MAG: helix-turn-helix domain-containing protein [Pseudohongiellaceae bacterium]